MICNGVVYSIMHNYNNYRNTLLHRDVIAHTPFHSLLCQ